MNDDLRKLLRNISPCILLLTAISVLLILGHEFKRDSPDINDVKHLTNMEMSINNGPFIPVTLPCTLNNLENNTQISLRAIIKPQRDDTVYIKSNYAKANVFFDNECVFSFGKEENYPSFMMSPAKEIHAIETYGSNKDMNLRIDYISPSTDNEFTIDSPMIGSSKELILERGIRYGTSWILSLAQVVGGLGLILISVSLLFIDWKGILFTYLGIFSLSTGLWFFGSNEFSITVFPDTTWLYVASFSGFMLCIVPLLQFIRISTDFINPKPIYFMEYFFVISILIAIILQLCKVVPLHHSFIFFRYSITASLIILTILIIKESIKWNNKYAKKYIIPLIILSSTPAITIILDKIFNKIFRFSFFQLGVTLFLLIMGIIAGTNIKDNITLKNRENELLNEKKLLTIQTSEQKERSILLAENEQLLRRQRHDLRHHLAIMMQLSKDNEEMQDYISSLINKIPTSSERFCENDFVNAIISHYASLCNVKNIEFNHNIIVPEINDQSKTSDLCVVFSNLLENAVEACDRIENDKKFINIKSLVHNNMLTIKMDNSYNGEYTKLGERFRSAKRNDFGIGVTSIQTIAQNSHGGSKFDPQERVFYSSVYFTID